MTTFTFTNTEDFENFLKSKDNTKENTVIYSYGKFDKDLTDYEVNSNLNICYINIDFKNMPRIINGKLKIRCLHIKNFNGFAKNIKDLEIDDLCEIDSWEGLERTYLKESSMIILKQPKNLESLKNHPYLVNEDSNVRINNSDSLLKYYRENYTNKYKEVFDNKTIRFYDKSSEILKKILLEDYCKNIIDLI